ncbi:30S ribosomal protein S13 [Candidatus Shapirobacteria bacterium]|nr:30S ribosomal protein S13 [Candidatus Shapirobacteria bacterium]
MTRIAGTDIPENKPAWIGLTYLYGIGRSNVISVLSAAGVDGKKRVKDLSSEEVGKLSAVLAKYKIGGDLAKEIGESIKRLKEIGCYRGIRHAKNLPVRGQRTKSNARTKRGKRVTIGAMKKEILAKTEKGKTDTKAK